MSEIFLVILGIIYRMRKKLERSSLLASIEFKDSDK